MNGPMHAKCPFSAPIVAGRAACSHAVEVVRRGGVELDCASLGEHARCSAVFAGLKAEGLAAFEVDDDLTSMPHSVLVKIQTGGLEGMRRLVGAPDDGSAGIGDVARLIGTAVAAYGGVGQLPYAALREDMRECRLARRRGR